jgi:hypothetical protein
MKKLLLIVLFLVYCAGVQQKMSGPYFYTNSVKDGYQILNTYDWKLISIDTIKTDIPPTYIFHYKQKTVP